MTIHVDDARVMALRGALSELLIGYSEVGRLVADLPSEWRDALIAPLARAADSAAVALAQS